jgi:hypothetical protein
MILMKKKTLKREINLNEENVLSAMRSFSLVIFPFFSHKFSPIFIPRSQRKIKRVWRKMKPG